MELQPTAVRVPSLAVSPLVAGQVSYLPGELLGKTGTQGVVEEASSPLAAPPRVTMPSVLVGDLPSLQPPPRPPAHAISSEFSPLPTAGSLSKMIFHPLLA